MKAVILSEQSNLRHFRDKSEFMGTMSEIAEMPVLWHIMKYFSAYGIREFIICAGYQQEMIKDWFRNYYLHSAGIAFDFGKSGRPEVHGGNTENWKVSVVNTDTVALSGGYIGKLCGLLKDEPFLLTYGDVISDIDIDALKAFHFSHRKRVTMTAVNAENVREMLFVDRTGNVVSGSEKDRNTACINGELMICDAGFLIEFLLNGAEVGQEPLQNNHAEEADWFIHRGFWKRLYSEEEKNELETIWDSGTAPWKIWTD